MNVVDDPIEEEAEQQRRHWAALPNTHGCGKPCCPASNLTLCVNIHAPDHLHHVGINVILLLQHLHQPGPRHSIKSLLHIYESNCQCGFLLLGTCNDVVHWDKQVFKSMVFAETRLGCCSPALHVTYLSKSRLRQDEKSFANGPITLTGL